jgi:putative membrane-bound dehydrogenase-like protein
VVRKLFSGFGTENYQARVNSLEYGLDGWVYGSCGMFGGKIKSHLTGKVLDLGHRDFRIKPDTGEIEPATGRTQQGRVRDDWGNWFGCDNSTLCRHYPLADHYLRRNPHVAPPESGVLVPEGPTPNKLYPISQQLQLFKLSGPPGQTTAACGLGIYRDDLLGKEYRGDVFTCEPVNLLIHRLKLTPKGSTFTGRRADDEKTSEFLASTDNWFRPVQVRTGPDGALWIVDMYRYVIEHPRWIPPTDLARLDVRAGHDMGRIYRVYPQNKQPRPIPRLDKLDTAGLVKALDSSNGWQRDLAGQMLLWKGDKSATKVLEKMVLEASRPVARLQALCVLGGLGTLEPGIVMAAWKDKHPGVRRQAVRLTEGPFKAPGPFQPALKGSDFISQFAREPNAQARLQLACTLGEVDLPRGGFYLGALALMHANDKYLRAAVLSSVNPKNIEDVFVGVSAGEGNPPPPATLFQSLLSVATAFGDQKMLSELLRSISRPQKGQFDPEQLAALTTVLEALERKGQALAKFADEEVRKQIHQMFVQARITAGDRKKADAERLAAVRLLGREVGKDEEDVTLLGKLLSPQHSAALQAATVTALARVPRERVADILTAGWKGHTPALQSQILDVLLSRDLWQRKLLASIEKKEVPAAHIDLARRQRLLAHKDKSIRERAAKLFGAATSPNRRKILQEYQDVVSLTGDGNRGKTVFAKVCSACHRLQDVGHAVGPDLAALSAKSPRYLLEEILDPNKNVDTRYVEYLAVTRNGRSLTGILASESTTSITLRGQEGKEQVLLRSELEELLSTGKSLMPEGLEKDLPKKDMADLLAYLTSTGPPPKQIAGNQPVVVRPSDGRLALLATNCEIYGGEITFEKPFQNIGYWHGVQDQVVWMVQLDKPGEFDVYLDWACDPDSAGNAYVLEGTRTELRGKVASTGGWDKYQQRKIGTVMLDAGSHRLTLRPDGAKLKGALLDLRGIHLVPKGQKPPFTSR